MAVVRQSLKKHGALLIGLSALALATTAMAIARPNVSPASVAAASVATESDGAVKAAIGQSQDPTQAAPKTAAVEPDDSNRCERQHWPYYSRDCLKDAQGQDIRMVSMTPEVESASRRETDEVTAPAKAAHAGSASSGNAPIVAASADRPTRRADSAHRRNASKRYARERMRGSHQEDVYRAQVFQERVYQERVYQEPVYQASTDNNW